MTDPTGAGPRRPLRAKDFEVSIPVDVSCKCGPMVKAVHSLHYGRHAWGCANCGGTTTPRPVWSRVAPVIGFDASFSHSAGHWAPRVDVLELTHGSCYEAFAIKSEPGDYPHRLSRINSLRSQFLKRVHTITTHHGPGLFVVEGYSMGSKNDRELHGELGGQLRLTMFDLGWDVLEVPPATLKKYATGKGDTKKNGMRMEVLDRKDWGYKSSDDNDCDAYVCMRFGFDWMSWKRGHPTTKVVEASLSKGAYLSATATVEPKPEKKRKAKGKAAAAPPELAAGGL